MFLFVAVEILARVVWPHGWSWGFVRWAGLLPVAGVAAFVSYRHMSGLLAHYGEEPVVYYIGPLAVDGLMIMATAALMAGGRAARATATAQTETVTHPTTVAPVAVPAVPAPVVAGEGTRTCPPACGSAATGGPSTPSPCRPLRRPKRVAPRALKPKPAVATPARSTTDIPVTASDPGRSSSQLAPAWSPAAATSPKPTARPPATEIGAGELAVKLRVSTSRAKQVLAALANTTDSRRLPTATARPQPYPDDRLGPDRRAPEPTLGHGPGRRAQPHQPTTTTRKVNRP